MSGRTEPDSADAAAATGCDSPDRHRRHGRGLARPPTPCSAATVAVKVLKREYADDADVPQPLRDRGPHAAALHHPNVAAVFDFGELPGRRPASRRGPTW